MNVHVQTRVSDVLRALSRLAETAERNGYAMLAMAAREASFDVSEASADERAFRESRGLQ